MVASAEVIANDKKHPCVEDALITRYWFPPRVVEATCTGDGADVAAVSLYVLPVRANAAETLMLDPKEFQ